MVIMINTIAFFLLLLVRMRSTTVLMTLQTILILTTESELRLLCVCLLPGRLLVLTATNFPKASQTLNPKPETVPQGHCLVVSVCSLRLLATLDPELFVRLFVV